MAEESTAKTDESQEDGMFATLGDDSSANAGGENVNVLEFPDVEGVDIGDVVFGGDDADGKPEGETKPDDDKAGKDDDTAKKDDEQKDDEGKKDEKDDDWDKDRQAKDIEIANSQKRLKQQQSQIDELTKAVKDLTETGSKKKEADDDDDEDEIEEIDEYSDATTIAKALKSRDRKIDKLADTLKSLRTEIADDRQQQAEDRQKRTEKEHADTAKTEFNAFLKDMDKEYGEPIRNEALDAAKKYFAGRGFNTTDNPPGIEAVNARVELECTRLHAAAKVKEAESKAKDSKPKVSQDTGSGGGTAMTPSTGSMREVETAMKREGTW